MTRRSILGTSAALNALAILFSPPPSPLPVLPRRIYLEASEGRYFSQSPPISIPQARSSGVRGGAWGSLYLKALVQHVVNKRHFDTPLSKLTAPGLVLS